MITAKDDEDTAERLGITVTPIRSTLSGSPKRMKVQVPRAKRPT